MPTYGYSISATDHNRQEHVLESAVGFGDFGEALQDAQEALTNRVTLNDGPLGRNWVEIATVRITKTGD